MSELTKGLHDLGRGFDFVKWHPSLWKWIVVLHSRAVTRYGIEGQGWFLGFHVFTHYVKVTFRGTSLRPVPPGGTSKDARWIDIHEDDLDEAS